MAEKENDVNPEVGPEEEDDWKAAQASNDAKTDIASR
jgi:hypothetical protein